MEIRLDASSGRQAELVHSDDFTAFKVVIADRSGRRDRPELGSLGSWVDDDHAAISVDGLRVLAGDVARTPAWRDGLAGMVGYAQSKGWMIGDAIRAHVEWQE